jgi:putative addiction module component (TIGR02574 family)
MAGRQYFCVMNTILEAEFRALSAAERILLVEELWDRIASEPGSVPLTPAQRAELDRRLDALEKNPDGGRPWPEVRDDLLRR